LLIVPDGPLHALPFEALSIASPPIRATLPDYATASYLIDRYVIEYLPSSAFLARSDAKRSESLAESRLLVVAYNAPGAEREAAAIHSVWPKGHASQLSGLAATEHATKAKMRDFDVLHFVVHASASARDPLASHLRLVRDSIDDGYLNLDEIAATRLGARLVVLSACETDAGPIYNGEGVVGLARAFLVAGTHAVIGTQWPVGPATAELMGEFYRRLAKGEAASPALRAAKLALRSNAETAHPFYWAGAVLVMGGGAR
jgi:CHAT domain-containing protein